MESMSVWNYSNQFIDKNATIFKHQIVSLRDDRSDFVSGSNLSPGIFFVERSFQKFFATATLG